MTSSERTKEFVKLLARHERSIYGLIASLVPNWADADEIFQETSVKLWENFDRFVPNTDFGAWARTVAKFQVMGYRTQAARRQRMNFSEEFVDRLARKVEQQASEGSDEKGHIALSDCLKKLDQKRRAWVTEYYAVDGPRLLAERLGRTVQSLRVTIFRIRRLLHECVEQQMKARAG